MSPRPRRQGGAALITAIFLLLLFAGLGAAMLDLGTGQQAGLAQDVQGTRALQAARAGLEWGFYQVLDPAHGTVVAPASPNWPNLPDCPAAATLGIDGFTVAVACSRSPSASPGYYEEAGSQRKLRIFEITATATAGTLGTATYVERRMSGRISKCRDNLGNSQRGYDCM